MKTLILRRRKRLLLVCASILITLSSPWFYSQSTTPWVSAEVILPVAYFRYRPSNSAEIAATVFKGARLKVRAVSTSRGWYVGFEEDVWTVGFIHGSAIRIVKNLARRPVNRIPDSTPPKEILLDKSPTVTYKLPTAPRVQTASKPTTNYCQPPLFCPDLNEVETILDLNVDKFSKGEFEKTVEWERRMKTVLYNIKLGDKHAAAETMVFFYERDREEAYDADEERWTFYLNFYGPDASKLCVPNMSEKSGRLFCLMIDELPGNHLKAFVKMAPATAAANDEKLKIGLVGKIVKPYMWSGSGTSITNILSGIHFDLEEIICLNPNTGEKWRVELDHPEPTPKGKSPL
jgi:hypothetical protein